VAGDAFLSKETALEGAAIHLTILPVTVDCASCGFKGPYAVGEPDVHNSQRVVECPRCQQATPVVGGRGVQDLEMVLEED
jgi:Zn finger protein HypA/HybF involved in hydrogenase expression